MIILRLSLLHGITDFKLKGHWNQQSNSNFIFIPDEIVNILEENIDIQDNNETLSAMEVEDVEEQVCICSSIKTDKQNDL